MSRSGYSEDCDNNWDMIKWRGWVASATRGKRGQAFFRELVSALEAMPEKRLIEDELRKDGEVCTLGALGAKRGVDLESISPDDHDRLATTFDVSSKLIQEVEYENDEGGYRETPEQRWTRMHAWAKNQLKVEAS